MLSLANALTMATGEKNHPIATREDIVANLDFIGYDPVIGEADYERIILAYLHASNGKKVRGVLFIGDAGNGKTMVAHALCNGLWIDAWNPDHEARFTTAYMKTLCDGGWVLDDLGREEAHNNYGIVTEPFVQLVNHQYARGYMTGSWQFPPIITTNLMPSAIVDRYNANVWDRLLEMFVLCEMKSKSQRKVMMEVVK